jgi:type I restriction enzyme S subunit
LKKLFTRRVAPIDKSARPLDTLNVIAKVTFGGELFLRGEKEKRSYKGPLFEALPGDLIISKIRVGQGSFCVIDDRLSHVAVSPEYPVYTPDPLQVLPRFLAMVLRTPEFMRRLTGSASGNTTKRRIRPAFFESLKVPLPELAEQQAIVAAYDAALKEAAAKEQAAEAAEAKAMADFEAALGFAPPLPLPDKPIFVASFKDLDRWSHEGVLRRMTGGATGTSAWPVVRLGDVIADLENGWSPKCLDRPAEPGEWGVLKVSAASAGRYRGGENKALPASLQPRPRLEVRAGDVLITRANGVAKLVGVSAYVEQTQSNLLICDKLFRAVFRPKSAIEPRFMAMVLRLHPIRAQIVREFSTESGMMKNVSKPVLLSLTFPLPPLEDQRALIKALNAERAEASRLRTEAAAVRVNAWAAFEAAVYAADAKTSVAAPNPTNEALAEALA